MTNIPYKRVLVKLSGEALMGEKQRGFCPISCEKIAESVCDLAKNGIEVGIVIGAGNLFRGEEGKSLQISRVYADYMGMLATNMNGIALQQSIERQGYESVVMTAIPASPLLTPHDPRAALHHIANKRIVIFSGGVGTPYFTTDTAAALRACEIQADLLIKATKVNGIYSHDPKIDKNAIRYDTLTYDDVLSQKLHVMDATAVALCMASNIPIFVCNMWASNKFSEILAKPELGTLVQ